MHLNSNYRAEMYYLSSYTTGIHFWRLSANLKQPCTIHFKKDTFAYLNDAIVFLTLLLLCNSTDLLRCSAGCKLCDSNDGFGNHLLCVPSNRSCCCIRGWRRGFGSLTTTCLPHSIIPKENNNTINI